MTLSLFSSRRVSILLFLILGIVACVGIYHSHRDLAGWVLVVASFVIVAVDPQTRHHTNLKYGIWLTLIAHHITALTYVFIPEYLPTIVDANSTHNTAVDWADGGNEEFGIGLNLYQTALAYAYRLGGYYRLGGESLLLGKELSIFAYTISCLVFVRFFKLLDIERYRATFLLLYGLTPTLLLYTSITMREAWIILAFMSALLFGIRFLRSGAMTAFAGLLICICVMSVLHKGLMFMALFVFVVFLVARLRRARDEAKFLLIVGLILIVGMTGAIFTIAKHDAPGSGAVRAVIAGRILDFIGSSRQLIDDARSTFDVALDTSSYIRLIPSFVPVYAHYLFGPFPWQISIGRDLYAMSESLARLLLLLFAVYGWRKASGVERQTLGIMLLMYIAITMLWALGTTNYGQAFRHHVTSTWILVLAGGAVLAKKIQSSK